MVRISAAALFLAASFLHQATLGADIQLLDFASPHCPPCRQMDPLIQSFVDAGYPIRKIDVTKEPSVAHQYGVARVPCFVMLVDGQEVDRVLGATSQDRISKMFDRARAVALEQAQVTVRNQNQESREQPRSAAPAPISALDAKLLNCSVRLQVEDAQGRSFGTGTMIDARAGEALVVTCGHLFRDSGGKGPITVELFESTPAGVRVVGQFPGTVISYDLDRDVGLVSIRPGRDVVLAPVAPAANTIDRGHRVMSVGCNNGADPTVMASRITTLGNHHNPPNVQATGAPVEGRSGGGLFNEQGELIGVCFAADYEGNQGLYVALESIHNELDKIGLSEVYGNPAKLAQADLIPRGQGPDALAPVAVSPVPESPQVQASNESPASLNRTEQAALEEILNRATTSEIVLIIRPEDAGGQSEVITLPKMSSGFVRTLLAAQKKSQAEAALR